MVVYQLSKNPDDKCFYQDQTAKVLNTYRKSVREKDFSFFAVIDGPVGSGKSHVCFQFAKLVDPTFNINRIFFDSDELIKGLGSVKKYQAVVLDEAGTLSGTNALTKLHRQAKSILAECRQRNIFVFFVLPSIWTLDKFITLNLANVLFHTYLDRNGRRGYYEVYGPNKIKVLELRGRRGMTYNVTTSKYKGRFTKRFVLDAPGETKNYKLYQKMKLKSLKDKVDGNLTGSKPKVSEHTMNLLKKQKIHRDYAFYLLLQLGYERKKLIQAFKKLGVPIDSQFFSDMCKSGEGYYKIVHLEPSKTV